MRGGILLVGLLISFIFLSLSCAADDIQSIIESSLASCNQVTSAGPACSLNKDCGGDLTDTTYCKGKTAYANTLHPLCRSPGGVNSNCVYRLTVDSIGSCAEGYSCYRGDCYPVSCSNGVLDYNELDVDCGGSCPACSSFEGIKCGFDWQCGKDHDLPYVCFNGSVYGGRVTYQCENGRCTSDVSSGVSDQCSGIFKCMPGERACVRYPGTCSNCLKDRNEDGVDCGGVCWPCAPQPSSNDKYTTYRITKDRSVDYFGYVFSYMRPLRKGNYDRCIYGAQIRVFSPDGTFQDLNITRYENNHADNVFFGFYNGDSDSVSVWVNGAELKTINVADECSVDSDCMTSSCCHPSLCVKNYPRVCNLLCTNVCSGPLDCGMGHCGCVRGKCAVVSDPGWD